MGDPTLTDPAQREAAFGHHDHLRIYGSDFPDFLTSSGFEVHQVSSDSFETALAERLVLKPPFPSPRPLATNKQILFFAVKPALRRGSYRRNSETLSWNSGDRGI